jgi:acetyl esterase/lipase
VQWAARTAGATDSSLADANPAAGFLVYGTSSGANLAASVTLLARDTELSPPLTGTFPACLTVVAPSTLPSKYTPRYLSVEQNAHAPIADAKLVSIFRAAFNPDPADPRWAVLLHPKGHAGLPKCYLQVCGMDMARDDGLIYESVLRESGVETRCDLYKGWPHCW